MKPQVGQIFAGRYRLERLLGDRGYAPVFEATDPEAGRRVALKIIRPDDDGEYTEELRRRFQAAVADLQDRHSVTLVDHGEQDGRLFLVFELVPGETLEALAALDLPGGGPRPSPDAPGREFTADDFSRQSAADDIQLDEEALAQRGASTNSAPRPRTRIQSREGSGRGVLEFGILLTLFLVAVSVAVVWYLDFEMPWNEVEPVDPSSLEAKVFPIESEDTAVFWVDWTRGIVYADDPLTVPAAGRCVTIFDQRSEPTPPGAYYVANTLDGYPEDVEAAPISREELSRRAEWCNAAGDLAWDVQRSAEVVVSRIRIERARNRKKSRNREIQIETIRKGKPSSARRRKRRGRKKPSFEMPDLNEIPGVR